MTSTMLKTPCDRCHTTYGSSEADFYLRAPSPLDGSRICQDCRIEIMRTRSGLWL